MTSRVEVHGAPRQDGVEDAARIRTLDELIKELTRLGREGAKKAIVDIIVQDEYSHDVVVRWDDGVYVVYGTT